MDTAERAFKIAQQQLVLGDTSAMVVVQAEQAVQQALTAQVQARASRLVDAAALFQALGGGWWNRSPEDRPGR